MSRKLETAKVVMHSLSSADTTRKPRAGETHGIGDQHQMRVPGSTHFTTLTLQSTTSQLVRR